MSKITISIIKSFIKKNFKKIYIKITSNFDTNDDCLIGFKDSEFNIMAESIRYPKNTLGIEGAWFIGNSRDYFEKYEDDEFTGYTVSNCCGSFIIAIKKPTDKNILDDYIQLKTNFYGKKFSIYQLFLNEFRGKDKKFSELTDIPADLIPCLAIFNDNKIQLWFHLNNGATVKEYLTNKFLNKEFGRK